MDYIGYCELACETDNLYYDEPMENGTNFWDATCSTTYCNTVICYNFK